MCGRYYIAEEDAAESFGNLLAGIAEGNSMYKLSGEVFPTDIVPVIANSRSMRITPFFMQWGYTMSDGKRVINARSETASAKPMFREGMEKRRCLIPASGYFEWERMSGEKYSVKAAGQGLFCMAGIYRMEQGRPVFSILTRAPEREIAFIHDRMPVILPKEAEGDYLNLNYRAEDVLRGIPVPVEYAQVSKVRQIGLWEETT